MSVPRRAILRRSSAFGIDVELLTRCVRAQQSNKFMWTDGLRLEEFDQCVCGIVHAW
jgi:hypothetical protein